MKGFLLIHWKPEEISSQILALNESGIRIDTATPRDNKFFSDLDQDQPSLIIIDLSRLPSQGRDLGIFLRRKKSTRYIPLIFLEGSPDKVDQVKKILPDAYYTSWSELEETISVVRDKKIADPVVPDSAFAAYRDKSLAVKLGIKSGMQILLLNCPAKIYDLLVNVTENVRFITEREQNLDLVICFLGTEKKLQDFLQASDPLISSIPFWVAWPKKSSEKDSTLNQPIVRKNGLSLGFVDYKICSIDNTWSALLFKKRK